MTRIFALTALISILALFGVTYFLIQGRNTSDLFAQCRATRVAGGSGQIGGPFTLVNQSGETVTSANLIDQPTLIYFGYTFCPDVCPLDSARNVEAVEILESKGMMVKPVFISIDPERDTPDVMAEFVKYQHARMVGLTGSPEQVKAASQAYRTYFKKQEPEAGEEDYYLVDHSTFTYLTFPGHGFAEFFRRDLTAQQLADRVACFVDAT